MSKFYNTTISLNSDGTVPYDRAVALTPKQQATARKNISVPSSREVTELMTSKQDKLVAGPGISIDPDSSIISATGGGSGDVNVLRIIGTYGTFPMAPSLEEVLAAVNNMDKVTFLLWQTNSATDAQVAYIYMRTLPRSEGDTYIVFEFMAPSSIVNYNVQRIHVYYKYKKGVISTVSLLDGVIPTPYTVSQKQDKLTAGTNISIVGNVISATGGSGSNIKCGAHATRLTKTFPTDSRQLEMGSISLNVESITSGFIDFQFDIFSNDTTISSEVPAHLLIDQTFDSGTQNLVDTTNFIMCNHATWSPWLSGSYHLKLPVTTGVTAITLRFDSGSVLFKSGTELRIDTTYSYVGIVE